VRISTVFCVSDGSGLGTTGTTSTRSLYVSISGLAQFVSIHNYICRPGSKWKMLLSPVKEHKPSSLPSFYVAQRIRNSRVNPSWTCNQRMSSSSRSHSQKKNGMSVTSFMLRLVRPHVDTYTPLMTDLRLLREEVPHKIEQVHQREEFG